MQYFPAFCGVTILVRTLSLRAFCDTSISIPASYPLFIYREALEMEGIPHLLGQGLHARI